MKSDDLSRKRENFPVFSLLSGNFGGERFALDYAHHHSSLSDFTARRRRTESAQISGGWAGMLVDGVYENFGKVAELRLADAMDFRERVLGPRRLPGHVDQ